MKPFFETEPTPPQKRGNNSYNPADIKRWGVQRFLEERAARGPFKMPVLQFSDEENRRMDEILEQERQAAADAL